MKLVERHIVKDNWFEDICLKSGLLYNYVLYNIRQGVFSGNYLKEFDLSNKLCKENQFDFRNLPNHVSQQVIKQVFKNIKSRMRLKKDFEKNPSKYGNHRPHLPSYKKGKNLVKTFRGKLFKKAFGRARRGKDISSFERQEKESGFNFLYNPNNGRMRSGHIIIDGIGLFKQIIESGT